MNKGTGGGTGGYVEDRVILAEQVAISTRDRERIRNAIAKRQARFDLAMRGAGQSLPAACQAGKGSAIFRQAASP